jgi:fusion and transport protein UGO1
MASNSKTPQPPVSLRDLYVDPNHAWSFTPPKPSNATVSNSGQQPQASIPPQPIYQYTPHPRHSPTSVFSLSPSLSPSSPPPDSLRLDYREPERVPLPHIFKSLVASFILQYTSTTIVMPWEVGKLLLQVQWVPRDAGEEVLDEDQEGKKDSRDDAVCTVLYTARGNNNLP